MPLNKAVILVWHDCLTCY